MPPKSYRPLPSELSLASFRFYATGGADRRDQFFRRRAHQGGVAERKAMIDRGHDLPITKPCQNTRQEIAQRLFVLLQISNHSVRTARGELFEEFSEAWEHSPVMRSHSRAKLDYCKPL